MRHLIKEQNKDVMEILETKLNQGKLEQIMNNKFLGWNQINNFQEARGRILILLNPTIVTLEVQAMDRQAISIVR